MHEQPVELTPLDLQNRLQQARQLINDGQREQAFALLRNTLLALQGQDTSHLSDPMRALRRLTNTIHPVWWNELGDHRVRLRRTKAEDAAFFAQLYADDDWARRFNRQQPWSGNLARALDNAGKRPPLETGDIQWIVETPLGQRLGLLSLSSLDWGNRKAEISIGMVKGVSGRVTLSAFTHALRFAFEAVNLNKLYAQVYTDNPLPRGLLQRLGFIEEGLLRDHYYLPPGQFHDVWVLGLTRKDWDSNPHVRKVARYTDSLTPATATA